MADLGNLKILLDMATTGNLKDILKKTDDALDKMREKASSLKLGFDEKSISALSTKMRDIVGSMQEVSHGAGQKLADSMQKTAEATKNASAEMRQQVTLSSDMEGMFKEMAGVLRTIADSQGKVTSSRRASVQATKEEEAEEQKLYDITRLRQIAEEKNGQLTADQVSVLKQMEAIEKSLVAIDEKHSTNLAEQLKKWMHYDGVTKEQLGTYQALITRMQAAMQMEAKATREAEKASRAQKKSAKEREASAKKQAQLETTIIRIETQLLGINEARLSTETQLLVAKMRSGQITQEEAGRLSALLSQHRAIVNAENQKVDAVKKLNIHLGRQSGLLQQINSYLATYVSVIGAANLIRNLIRITGEFEAQHVALRAILQDVAGADRIFYQLQELAVKSPFTFRNLTDYAKQLSAFSVPMNEIYDTTKRLADVSAGLGVDMSRIILAYGQIRSASFLRGQEVRQLTEAGIPVLQELAKQFKEVEGEAITVGKVFDKISARQVPFEMIEKMFKDLTSEGGKFYQMQETLAETVKGKVSNLQDAWEIMLSRVGESNSGFIKGVLDGVTNLIKNYKELAKAIELVAVAYGTYRVACIAATQAQAMQGLVMAANGTKINAFSALLTRFAVGLRNLPKAITGIVSKLNIWAVGIAVVTTAVAALIMRNRELNKHIRETDKLTSDAIAKAEASKSNIQYYINQMKAAKEGTEEYNRARQAVIDNSGAYISATDAERLSLQSVDDVWVNICKHIEEATKLQAMQSITANAEATKQQEQMDLAKELAGFQQDKGLSNEMRQNIAAYMRREITRDELKRRLEGKITGMSPSPYKDAYDLDGNVSIMGAKQYVSTLDIVLNKADDLWDRFYASDRKFQETLAHGKQNLSDLYGTGAPEAAGAPAPLTGWRLRVQQYLDSVTGSKHGVSVSDETSLADLAEKGAKSLNDLRDQLNLIPKTEDDYKKVEAQIKFWEKLSEAIYGAGNTDFNNSTKGNKERLKEAEALRKEQIAAIKQSVQDLKEAKRWYDQLTPLIGAQNAKALLASFNFAVPGEGFAAAFQGYADQLRSLGDENGARDVMNWSNGREIGDVVNSAKAIEKYTTALKEFEAQTKRLKLSDFAQELDKIIVDADSKNRQVETNWAQKMEELEKAKGGWIQQYQIENPTKDAEAAWAEFYKKQTDMAKKAIDTQKEYNSKVAQEQINDRASKWLQEMMRDNNINLQDMNDKSIGQMDVIISRLRSLVTSNALAELIPEELKEDAAALNINFETLLSNLQKIVDTKVGDVQVDRMKKILSGVSSGLGTLGLSANMSGVQDAYAKYIEKIREEKEAREELEKSRKEYQRAITENISTGKDITMEVEAWANAQKQLTDATEATGEALRELQFNAVIAGVQALASAFSKLGSSIAKLGDAKGDESMTNFGNAVSFTSNAVASAAGAAIAGAMIGGPMGAAVGAALSIASSLASSLVEAEAKAAEYNRRVIATTNTWALAVKEVRNEYALLQKQLDTIFGSSTLMKMSGWANTIKEQADAIRKFNNTNYKILDWRDDFFGYFNQQKNGEKNAAMLAETLVKTQDYSRLSEFFGNSDEYKKLGKLVPELFNDDGTLNFDYLDSFKNTAWYENLSDEWKKTLAEMEEANKQFEAACAEMKDYLTSIFGEVGTTITDQLVSAFVETGRVAMDTGEIISDVAKRFVNDWTQAFLIKNYLSDLGDSINDIWMDGTLDMEEQISQSIGLLRDTLTAMGDRLPEIQEFYKALDDQFHWANGAGEEIGDAIKTAMVEQNSSLIAGYINSIRTDLTMQRNEIMRNISPAVTTISNGLTEHFKTVASIEGNVSRIWARLDLLTTSGSSVKINTRI